MMTPNEVPTRCAAWCCGMELSAKQRESFLARKRRGVKIRFGPYCCQECKNEDYKYRARQDRRKAGGQ